MPATVSLGALAWEKAERTDSNERTMIRPGIIILPLAGAGTSCTRLLLYVFMSTFMDFCGTFSPSGPGQAIPSFAGKAAARTRVIRGPECAYPVEAVCLRSAG